MKVQALAAPMARTDRVDVLRPLGWCIAGPALAVWPLVSAMPLFSLLGGAGSAIAITIDILLLATGFWAVAALYAGYRLAHAGNRALNPPARHPDAAIIAGLYGTAWMSLYLVVTLLG